MSNLLSGLSANSVIQGIIAIICVAGTFALILQKQEVPTVISTLDGAVIAFYFANVQTSVVAKAVTSAVNGINVHQP